MTDHDLMASIVARGLGYRNRLPRTLNERDYSERVETAEPDSVTGNTKIADASPSTKRDGIPSEQQTTHMDPTEDA